MFREFKTLEGKPIAINDARILYVYPGMQVSEGELGVHVPNTNIVMSRKNHDGMEDCICVLGSYDEVMDKLVVV